MKRNKEWAIKSLIESTRTGNEINYVTGEIVKINEDWNNALKFAVEIIDQLEEPKKPVVPQFVAEWYEKRKGNLDDELSILVYEMGSYDGNGDLTDFECWFIGNKNTILTLSDMRYDYEVEKEKLYTSCFRKGRMGIFLFKSEGTVKAGDNLCAYDPELEESHLTEKEIKDYDERFWAFAEPVEEEAE